jgi:hypothetical protein
LILAGRTAADSTTVLVARLFLVLIAVETLAGVIAGSLIDPLLERDTARLVAGVLLVVGLLNVLTARFTVLPGMVKKEPATRAAVTGYTLAGVPASYGLIAAILAGEGLVAIPFGALSLGAWFMTRSYIAGRSSSRLEEFPQL